MVLSPWRIDHLKIGICFQASLLLAMAAMTPAMRASEIGSATLSSTQVDPTTWLYSIQLDDIGATNVGTFWFAWVPGEDFMGVSPTDISSPAGWTDSITNAGPSDGYAIQWLAGAGDAIQPGNTLGGFKFESTISPTSIAANSPFYSSTPTLTSTIYSGAPFSDAGFQFVAQQQQASSGTPEPGSIGLAAIGALALSLCLRRRIHS
jgi:hypothetical protein